MIPENYTSLVVRQTPKGTFQRTIEQRPISRLPDHDVLVRVHYSALNYKDALSATGNKGVTQQFPHTPGIDAAGIIAESRDDRFTSGEAVIVTNYDLGQNTDGGFGQFIRVPGDWIVPLPDGLTLRESMMLGTAGFTAARGMLYIINHHIHSDDREILVTGATGGVGSMAVHLLDQKGFNVTAATGKQKYHDFLRKIGAANVISRNEILTNSDRPLLSSRWAAALDTVGGTMLDGVLRQTKQNGVVTCCGNVLGGALHTSIYPFILRGIILAGIDSGNCAMPLRNEIWHRLATEWKPTDLETIAQESTLQEVNSEIDAILAGEQVGKVVIKIKE